jgi:pyrroloquinoline quinone (PQQ) biosynthesis protein C
MNFFEELKVKTESDRQYLLSAPIITDALNSDVTLNQYVDFLSQAYHHVKHTTPLLMATGSRINEEQEWLREAVAEYIEEELGHQEWILNDIQACGSDKEAVRKSRPKPATELMVSHAYDTINRINPLGFFGMVHVLEGTSISIADTAADCINKALKLPESAFSYLRSHGAIDIQHVKFFEELMNRIDNEADKIQIIHSAKMFYWLYGNIFRSIDSQ